MVVAIDGPAGTGKSSVSKAAAEGTGFFFLNSGRFYRAITWKVLQNEGDASDRSAVIETARELNISVDETGFFVDGVPRDEELHTPRIDEFVAPVSSIPEVREEVNRRLKEIAGRRDIIVEGRDMSTVVFPDAEIKIFLDADPAERARRRHEQQGGEGDLQAIEASIRERDELDRTKETGRLAQAPDAIYLETTDLTLDQVCEKVIAIIHEKTNHGRSNQEIMADKEAQFADSSSNESQSQEMQMQFLDQLDQLEEGQLVEGTVIQISGDEVFVDIGYKAEGRIPMEEFETEPDVGDTVEVVLLRKDIRNGGVAVSKRKADEKRFWKDLKQAFEERLPVQGKVVRSIKGGFEIRLQGNVRGFNPISKIDIRRVDDPEEYVGVEDKFFVERIYSDNRVNIVLSRRAWLEQETEKNRNEFFDNITIGDEVDGVVKSFTSFGAFIDLGGFDGLLHINDMSWGHVTRPKDYVKKGQEIRLKVIKMDPEERKINLSLRHMTPDPWETFEDRYWVDQVVKGTVTKLTDFGAFIELEEGIEGLVHISEMSWVQRINHPREILQPGQEVETKVLDYDIQAGRVSLGLKQVLANPWEDIDTRYPVGMRLNTIVKKITSTGAFLEIEPGIDAFLHVDDLSWTKRYKNPGAVLQEGQELEVVVVLSDPENQNIRVGLKQLEDDPWNQLRDAFPPRSIIEGEITNITEFGIFVRVQGGVEGLINKMNVADPRQQTFEDAIENYKVGETVRCVVTEVNPSRQRLSLSIRELHRQEQRQELEKYIHDEDDSGTVTLGDMLKEKQDG